MHLAGLDRPLLAQPGESRDRVAGLLALERAEVLPDEAAGRDVAGAETAPGAGGDDGGPAVQHVARADVDAPVCGRDDGRDRSADQAEGHADGGPRPGHQKDRPRPEPERGEGKDELEDPGDRGDHAQGGQKPLQALSIETAGLVTYPDEEADLCRLIPAQVAQRRRP